MHDYVMSGRVHYGLTSSDNGRLETLGRIPFIMAELCDETEEALDAAAVVAAPITGLINNLLDAAPTVAPKTAANPLDPCISIAETISGAIKEEPSTQIAKVIQMPIAVKGLAAVTTILFVGFTARLISAVVSKSQIAQPMPHAVIDTSDAKNFVAVPIRRGIMNIPIKIGATAIST